MHNFFNQMSRYLSLCCLWISISGLILMSLIIIWQVFARYVLNSSPSWSEQAALFLMVWTIMFAAAAGVREEFHVRITVPAESLKRKTGINTRIIAHLITAIIGGFMLRYGAELVLITWSHTIPTLGLPRGTVYIPLPVSGALIILFSNEHIFAILKGEKVKPSWN